MRDRPATGGAIRQQSRTQFEFDSYFVRAGSVREQALIYYRIGTIRQRSGDLDAALAAFYRSEAIYKDESISDDLNVRVQSSLEALGKYAVLRRELGERTSIEGTEDQADVVASIGSMNITQMDIDRLIEDLIEAQLKNYTGALTQEEIDGQKEALFSRYASKEIRQSILEAYLAEELLSTKARQLELHQEPDVARLLDRAERSILAQALIQKSLDDGIRIADVDVENHYAANMAQYAQPERARIQHILITDEERAREIHSAALAGESFTGLAEMYSDPEWVLKGSEIPGIGFNIDAITLIFSTAPGQVCERLASSERGFHIIRVIERQDERQKSLDEVRSEVRAQLYALKEEEIQRGLMTVLKKEYDVVLYGQE